MRREDMICGECLNGEVRVVGDNKMVKCFLNPDITMKGEFERCAQGQWEDESCGDRYVYYWGDI